MWQLLKSSCLFNEIPKKYKNWQKTNRNWNEKTYKMEIKFQFVCTAESFSFFIWSDFLDTGNEKESDSRLVVDEIELII